MSRAEGQPLRRSAHLSPRPSPQQSLAPVVTCSRGLCSFPCLEGAAQSASCSWLCYSREHGREGGQALAGM